MSYILDALRKSEHERSLDNIPILKTMSARTSSVDSGWRAAFLVLIAGVLGVAAVAAFVDRDGIEGSGEALLRPAENVMPGQRTESPPSANGSVAPITVEITPPALEIPPIATPGSFSKPVADAMADSEAKSEVDRQLTKLPTVLADIVVNVISYSTDSNRRFIMVGERVLKEGDALQAGAIINSITKDAVIIAYAGRQYRLQP
ncbi:MAG: general secretion pathway protein GspB [Gammaproteobacteria bacterium]|nr:general secretion pathway protein GspB [Gammaproteobacteria bacterium]MDH3465481.1 general secretion pathway protein GspB [Gammaproteobacteria bacterium]